MDGLWAGRLIALLQQFFWGGAKWRNDSSLFIAYSSEESNLGGQISNELKYSYYK